MQEHDGEETVELVGRVGVSERQHAAHLFHAVYLTQQQDNVLRLHTSLTDTSLTTVSYGPYGHTRCLNVNVLNVFNNLGQITMYIMQVNDAAPCVDY